MPWNSSGTFSRKNTSVSPASGNTTIDSADMNTYTADVTDGINAARAKNGENSPTANLPMGGYKHTGVAEGAARDQYLTVSQQQDAYGIYVTDTGAADAYVMVLVPAISANVVGAKYSFKAANANTGASTLNINGIGAEDVKNQDGSALIASDIAAGVIHTVVWDGTNYVLENNALKERSTFANNSNDNPNISDTVLVVTAAMNIQTWESVGPTGSSADNIWTAMDSIPAGVSWVEIKLSYTDSATTTGDNVFGCKSYARATGGAQAVGEDNSIVNTRYNNPAASSSTEYIYYGLNLGIKIPVDGSIRFDIYWDVLTGDPDGEAAFQATLTGYGYN